jgi:MFS family permease
MYLGGYSLGSANALSKQLQTNFKWTASEATQNMSFFVAMVPLGFPIGAIIAASLVNKIGRFKTLIIGAWIANGGFVLMAIENYPVVLVARLLIGIGTGSGYSIVSLYLNEITPKEMRAKIGACTGICLTLGYFSVYLLSYALPMNTEAGWRIVAMFPIATNLLQLLFCYLFLSESPKFLLFLRNDESATRKVLEQVYNEAFIEEVLQELKQKERGLPIYSCKDFLTHFWKQLLFGIYIATVHQFGGTAAINFFSGTIFTLSGIPATEIRFYVVIQGVAGVVGACIATLLTRKFSIKHILMIVLSLLAAIDYCIAATFAFGEYQATTVLVYLFVLTFFSALGPGLFIVVGQILPTLGCSIVFMAMGCSSFTAGFSFLYIKNSSMGVSGAFFLYGSIQLIGVFYTYFGLPDIHGKNFEDIRKLFGSSNKELSPGVQGESKDGYNQCSTHPQMEVEMHGHGHGHEAQHSDRV